MTKPMWFRGILSLLLLAAILWGPGAGIVSAQQGAQFEVRVATGLDNERAEAMRKTLIADGFSNANVVASGGTFSVVLGPFPTREPADASHKELIGQGYQPEAILEVGAQPAAPTAAGVPPLSAAADSGVPAPSAKVFRVRVGEFPDEASAKGLSDALQQDEYVNIDVIRSGEQFVVLLGSFDSESDAEKLSAQLRSDGYPQATVTSSENLLKDLAKPVANPSTAELADSVATPLTADQRQQATDLLRRSIRAETGKMAPDEYVQLRRDLKEAPEAVRKALDTAGSNVLASVESEKKLQSLFIEFTKSIRDQNWEVADKKLQEASQIAPGDVRIDQKIALLQNMRNMTERQNKIGETRDKVQEAIAKARDAEMKRDNRQARELYNQVLAIDANNAEAKSKIEELTRILSGPGAAPGGDANAGTQDVAVEDTSAMSSLIIVGASVVVAIILLALLWVVIQSNKRNAKLLERIANNPTSTATPTTGLPAAAAGVIPGIDPLAATGPTATVPSAGLPSAPSPFGGTPANGSSPLPTFGMGAPAAAPPGGGLASPFGTPVPPPVAPPDQLTHESHTTVMPSVASVSELPPAPPEQDEPLSLPDLSSVSVPGMNDSNPPALELPSFNLSSATSDVHAEATSPMELPDLNDMPGLGPISLPPTDLPDLTSSPLDFPTPQLDETALPTARIEDVPALGKMTELPGLPEVDIPRVAQGGGADIPAWTDSTTPNIPAVSADETVAFAPAVAAATAPPAPAKEGVVFEQNFDDETPGASPKGWAGEYDYASLLVDSAGAPEGSKHCIKFEKRSGAGSANFSCHFPKASGVVIAEFDIRCDEKNKYLLGFYIEKDEDFKQAVHTIVHRLDSKSQPSLRIQGEPVSYDLGTWRHVRYEINLMAGTVSATIDGANVFAEPLRLPSVPTYLNTLSIRDNLATTGVLYLANLSITRQ